MKTTLKVACLASALVLTPLAARAQEARTSFDWSGFYVGAHVGWLWGDIGYHEPDLPGRAISPDSDGVAGGALVGYRYQIERLVIGIEADGGPLGASVDASDSGPNDYSAFDVDWNAHVRARLGMAFDRTLLYVAGGLAIAQLTLDDTDPGFGDDDATHLGWTVGGGVEHAVTDSLTLRLEYLYDDYGEEGYTIALPPGLFSFPSYSAEVDLTAHTLRAALSYRF
ncbi:MAG: outer membrane protein [Alphaproteobacteria bacterium]